jgi:NADH-quinone oxidoreductase subunit I
MQNKVRTIAHSLYTIYMGMKLTLRYLFGYTVTVQYPDERRPLPERYRGKLHNDTPDCIICDKCARICPVDCIKIESVGKGKNRLLTTFDIDLRKCMYCGLCTEVCPTECLTMKPEYEYSTFNYHDLYLEFANPTQEEIAAFLAKQAQAAGGKKPARKPARAKATGSEGT